MLRLQNVSLVRGVRVLYKNVNLTTSDGEIIGLVGPNGPASPRFSPQFWASSPLRTATSLRLL